MKVTIKIDESTLPKEDQLIKWQTQEDINNDRWSYGSFMGLEEMIFTKGFEDTSSMWDMAYDVHQWEALPEDIKLIDIPVMSSNGEFGSRLKVPEEICTGVFSIINWITSHTKISPVVIPPWSSKRYLDITIQGILNQRKK